MAEGEDYESVLCVKPEVHVYRVPPRASNRGYRAAEWQLDQPAWSGRMRITARGSVAFIKLEDKNSGELFAQASVEQFPSIAVEGVTDSSRYFVIRVEDGNGTTGRRAFIGIGFVDRGDAFDFNVALQDHFKWVKQQDELAKEAQNPTQGPKLDLGFKEGQTIKLSIANMKKKDGSSGSRSRTADSTGLPLLPPPPGGKAPFLPTPGEQLPLPLLGPQQMPPKQQMLPGLGPHSRQVLQEKLLQTSGEISPKLLGPALSLSRTRVGSSSEQKGRPKGQGEGPLLEARDREMGSAPLALPTDPLPGWV
ncbi:putative NECAP endocytosis associated 2 protein [Naja naja]|nr:putative NECAP endocytosis associated 2 protein [Naja naja]